MFGSRPVHSIPPSFPTTNSSNETLPIASDDEATDYGEVEPGGTETIPQGKTIQENRLAITPRINSLTQSFLTAGIRNDMSPIASNIEDEHEQAFNERRDATVMPPCAINLNLVQTIPLHPHPHPFPLALLCLHLLFVYLPFPCNRPRTPKATWKAGKRKSRTNAN